MTDICKSQVCIILPQKQPVLRTACHHSVWLGCFLSYKVIDQNSDVGIRPGEHHRLLIRQQPCSIYSGHKSLGRSLLITAAAVHLSCKEKPLNSLRLQRWFKGCSRNAVIFNGISRPYDLCIFKSCYGMDHSVLNILRH